MYVQKFQKVLHMYHLKLKNQLFLVFLTTDTIEQAIERAGTKAGNKGYDAAVTAIEMANLLKNF